MEDDSQFKLISQAFRDNGMIPPQYTCKGQGVSPPLIIVDPPKGTKSFALIMHDPDAVSGDFTHWLLWDILASTETIAANTVPVGALQGKNDAGSNEYTPPCPPPGSGVHRYMFELYALGKGSLGLMEGSDRATLEQAMNSQVLGQCVLTGKFPADDA